MMRKAEAITHIKSIPKMMTSFVQFVQERDDTWKFWKQFVFTDCMAYVALWC
jgi:hypothetical protein